MSDIADKIKDWYVNNVKYFSMGDPNYSAQPVFQNRTTRTWGSVGETQDGIAGTYVPDSNIGDSIASRLQHGLKLDPATMRGLDSLTGNNQPYYTIAPRFAQDTGIHSHEAAHDMFAKSKFSPEQIAEFTKAAGSDNQQYYSQSPIYGPMLKQHPETIADESFGSAIGSPSPANQDYVNFVASKMPSSLRDKVLLLNKRARK